MGLKIVEEKACRVPIYLAPSRQYRDTERARKAAGLPRTKSGATPFYLKTRTTFPASADPVAQAILEVEMLRQNVSMPELADRVHWDRRAFANEMYAGFPCRSLRYECEKALGFTSVWSSGGECELRKYCHNTFGLDPRTAPLADVVALCRRLGVQPPTVRRQKAYQENLIAWLAVNSRKRQPMINLEQPFSAVAVELRIRSIAAHEAGHVVMNCRFGVKADAHLEFNASGELVGAVTIGDPEVADAFERGCCGWAGVFGEWLLGYPFQHRPELPPLTAHSVSEWARLVWQEFPLNHMAGDRPLVREWPNWLMTAEFTFATLASEYGSSRLYQQFCRLTDKFRSEYALAAADRLAPPLVREFAQKLFGPPGIHRGAAEARIGREGSVCSTPPQLKHG
jgi:hypothetical protein